MFNVYHKDQRIETQRFEKKLSELSGSERSKNSEIVAIRKTLGEDMKILRAIRAYDKKANVLLAELAYTIVTYDSSILDATDKEALKNFSVSELTPSLKTNYGKDTSQYNVDKSAYSDKFQKVSLRIDGCDQGQCIQDAYK